MKKLILLLLFSALAFVTSAQVINGRFYNPLGNYNSHRGITLDSNANLPRVIPQYGFRKGAVMVDTVKGFMRVFDGDTWKWQIGITDVIIVNGAGADPDTLKQVFLGDTSVVGTFTGSGGSSAWADITGKPTTLAGYGITDPIVLTSSSYSDPAWITALAWSKITGAPSFITNIPTDSSVSINNRINLKLNISDTAAMLAPYLRKVDTTAMLDPYLRKADTTGKWIGIGQAFLLSDTASKTWDWGDITGTPSPGTPNVDSTAARIARGTFAQRPSAPDTGQIFEQTDRLAGTWKYNGDQWDFLGANLRYSHKEQFSNSTISVPQLSGAVSGTGASGSIGEAVGLGSYAILTTGTTSSGYATYGFQNASTFILTLDSMIQYQENRVMIPVLGNGTDNFNVAVGWLGHQSTWTFGSALFWYNYNSGGGVWQTFTRKYDNTGTMTYKVSAVTVAANQWYRLGILVNGYTQTIQFYIDDVLVTTHSTAGGDNIPMPGSTVSSQYNFGITKTAGTTARSLYIDHSFLYYIKRKYQ